MADPVGFDLDMTLIDSGPQILDAYRALAREMETDIDLALTAAAPAQLRATVMSAFYIVAYLSLSVPAVLAGLVVGRLGLIQTFRLFGLVVIALALAVGIAAWHMQTSPRTPGTPDGDMTTRNPDAAERGAPAWPEPSTPST